MIARLSGTVVEVRTEELVLDVNGVGYLVSAPSPVILAATVGESLVLQISTVVREDAFLLYGFTESAQREAFELVRGVSRIGPKHALSILSTLEVNALASAIAAGDAAALARAPGIGKKSAERVCLELKNKIPTSFSVAGAIGVAPRPRADDPLPLALSRLGYRKSEIDRVMADPSVPDYGGQAVEERLRACLRLLAQPG